MLGLKPAISLQPHENNLPVKARFPILVSLILLSGCQMAEKKIVGQWDEESQSNNLLTNMAVQGGPKGKLVLIEGHKFTFESASLRTNPGDPRSAVSHGHKIEGTWALHDQDIEFTSASVDGGSVADFQAKEQKEIADAQGTVEGISDGIRVAVGGERKRSPEEQRLVDKNNAELKTKLDEFAKELYTPIPRKGSLSSGFYTLTVECVTGKSLQFGK